MVGTSTPSINSTYTVTVLDGTSFTVLSNCAKPSIASISTGNPCTVTTTGPHGFVAGNLVTISGVNNGTFSPTINGTFTVVAAPTATTFTVASNCTAVPTIAPTLTGNYGGALAANGIYSVESNPNGNSFTVLTADTPIGARTGNVIVPKFTTSYTPVSSNNVVQYNCNVNHNLLTGDRIWVDVPVVGTPVTDAEYTVSTPITGSGIAPADEDHFQTSYLPISSSLGTYPKPSGANNGITIFPLVPPIGVAPSAPRSGNVSINQSTFNLGSTEGTLTQSPFNSPTVFNFFFPDYKFPGLVEPTSKSPLDSPEFQLTTDTNVMNLTNSLTNMFIGTGGGNGNVNGLSSFNNGNGTVVMNIEPYLTPAKTTDTGSPGISGLIDELANLLVGAPLEAATKTEIQNFVTGLKIASISVGNPCTITTSVPHRYGLNSNGSTNVGVTTSVTISGVVGGTFRNAANTANLAINSTYTATVTGPTTITVPVNCTSIAGLDLASAGVPKYFPMTTPTPSNQQMRDRVRAIIHLIITSAEYAVQK